MKASASAAGKSGGLTGGAFGNSNLFNRIKKDKKKSTINSHDFESSMSARGYKEKNSFDGENGGFMKKRQSTVNTNFTKGLSTLSSVTKV